jgi:hypothetical protein
MILDVSAVTDSLINVVKSAWGAAPIWAELGAAGPTFTPTFTGLAPDAVRLGSGPQLSLFLYHVELNNAQESMFWDSSMVGAAEPATAYMPMALNLYYLLSSFCEASYAEEQQAMSVAMRIFHGHPILASDTTANPAWTLNLTMERRSYDELSLLWQATTAPLRLGVVYRAAVMFIGPDTPPGTAPEVTIVSSTINNSDTVTVTP